MQTYIILANLTQQGITQIKESPARIDAGKEALEAAGGKLLGWYLTMGRYDFVYIAQVPDAQTATALLLGLGAEGNVRTESLPALSEAEFRGIVANLP